MTERNYELNGVTIAMERNQERNDELNGKKKKRKTDRKKNEIKKYENAKS